MTPRSGIGRSQSATHSVAAARDRRDHLRTRRDINEGALRQFPANRRADQPRQLRWTDIQSSRPGDWHQYRDLFAFGRLGRDRVRSSLEYRQARRHPAQEHGHVTWGWLGIAIQNVTPPIAKSLGLDPDHPTGALVASVTADRPAARAGIKQGDVITAAAVTK